MENENNQNVALCDLCGERPGSVEVTFVAGGEQRAGLLCERCARAALAQQQGLAGAGPVGSVPTGQAGGPAVRQQTNSRRASGTPRCLPSWRRPPNC